MSVTKGNHVRFVDEHMENYDQESSALHRKLNSKIEALKIMRTELERFRSERDQFKLMAETLQLRYTAIKNSLDTCDNNDLRFGESSSVGTLLNRSREKNIALTTEIETTKQKLQELQGDIKILRKKNAEMTAQQKNGAKLLNNPEQDERLIEWNEEKSKLIAQLEHLKKKNAHLQYDFRSLLDEKEEIVTERDVFKCKAHRLNHELNVVLKGDDSQIKVMDIDALVLENKFLQERIGNLENQLDHSNKATAKFQSMLETKRVKGIVKLGDNCNNEMIMSHKQVKKLLNEGTVSELPLKAATISDLKSLCIALLDNLNDKTIALGHQKKTNRLLAAKIGSLEHRIKALSGDNSESSLLSASQILLNGYTCSKVDEDLRFLTIDEESFNKISIHVESSDSNKSFFSSEFETISDLSSEYKNLHYIKVINDDELEADEESLLVDDPNDPDIEEKLEDLPPEIAKLVEEALLNSN
ncbi:unnamed protein product [Diamesa tonsa]